MFGDAGLGVEAFDNGVQGRDLAATFVDPHVVIGQLAAAASSILFAAHVDQRHGLGALINKFVEMGGVGGEMST